MESHGRRWLDASSTTGSRWSTERDRKLATSDEAGCLALGMAGLALVLLIAWPRDNEAERQRERAVAAEAQIEIYRDEARRQERAATVSAQCQMASVIALDAVRAYLSGDHRASRSLVELQVAAALKECDQDGETSPAYDPEPSWAAP